MYKTYNPVSKKSKKEIFMTLCESGIVAKLPELKGRFESVHLWDALNYYYLSGKTVQESIDKILSNIELKG